MGKQIWLAGTSFGDMKLFIDSPELPTGLALELRREPQNKFDKNAVAVWLTQDALERANISGPRDGNFCLGHIPAKDGTAAWLAPIMDAGRPVSAVFVRHGSHGGVQIEIAGYEDASLAAGDIHGDSSA